jgi:hypothetical protein
MNKGITLLLLTGYLVFPGCPSPKNELCDKDLRAKCGGCSPKIQALANWMTVTRMDSAVFLEVKHCADATLNASSKDVKYAEGAFKGCLSTTKKIDEKIRDKLLTTWDDAKPSEEESKIWVGCYTKWSSDKQALPIVVLMDSHFKDLVYCSDTAAKGGSNTADIANLLASMQPRVALAAVPTYLDWQDDQQVLNLDPKLIVIHASAFFDETKPILGNQRLMNFLESVKNSRAKVLVYTRGLPDQPEQRIKDDWERITKTVAASDGKFQLFIMPKGTDPCFKNPLAGEPFRNKVREMLATP